MIYVDNAMFFGTDPRKVNEKMRLYKEALEQRGLPTHFACEAGESSTDVLGWRIEARGRIRPMAGKVWRLRSAIDRLIQQREVSAQVVGKVFGRYIFLAAISRGALSCCGSAFACADVPGLWSEGAMGFCSTGVARFPRDMDAARPPIGIVSGPIC